MKKTVVLFILMTMIIANGFAQKKPLVDVDKAFDFAAKQYTNMLASHQDLTKFPQSTKPNGEPYDRTSEWWCSGFFGGSLWYLYEYTQGDSWKVAADKWTRALDKEKYNKSTHDLGFMLYCPYGNGYRITQNKDYIEPMVTGANSLATRFNPAYGLIKSWDKHADCEYPVIIDNMMNLEFLFWVAKQTKDKRLYDIAVTHADNTMKHHFRKDFSSYHVVCYLPGTKVFRQKTHQGAADSSAWARGQAWAVYGYTLMYRETKDKKYLKQAEGIANFVINHPNLPADKVPYWDFDRPGEERDASAAAVFASAFLELSTFSKKNKDLYFNTAEQMLASLASPAYTANLNENNNFILKHSVGHKPAKSEINTPIVYADYYYLEALLRYKKLTAI
ncbi:Glycosyl Hydrolase Family 88 [Pedobacter sp. ok626]|uniref:glycoside hydrolase family 88 protein n=1 Tax=Pedobacter sp. ok626 TaxID=1761882 RepID=UPI00088A2108|nr:glycoside hydrolase family 88 protein [Pedobacter sp. ok626]SDJ05521.1 Glycosyl Hydrolase Family 88 [Pedobacter sp. ok626]